MEIAPSCVNAFFIAPIVFWSHPYLLVMTEYQLTSSDCGFHFASVSFAFSKSRAVSYQAEMVFVQE